MTTHAHPTDPTRQPVIMQALNLWNGRYVEEIHLGPTGFRTAKDAARRLPAHARVLVAGPTALASWPARRQHAMYLWHAWPSDYAHPAIQAEEEHDDLLP